MNAAASRRAPDPIRWHNLSARCSAFDFAAFWMKGIKGVLSLLIVTILLALAGGVAKTFFDLRLLLSKPVEIALRHILLETLMLLAVVEVFRTTLAYFTEGRVKVTFIVDTILVVMLPKSSRSGSKERPGRAWHRWERSCWCSQLCGSSRCVVRRASAMARDSSLGT